MPKITRVYTRSGDDGSTALANGLRVAKDSPRVAAFGTVDELSSHLGCARAHGLEERLGRWLATIQNDLFHLGCQLATPVSGPDARPVGPQIEPRHVEALEHLMDELLAELEPLENFVLPGGCAAAAELHVARTVCRRAEREVVALARLETVPAPSLHYLNRLSDALFVLARAANRDAGAADVLWDSRS